MIKEERIREAIVAGQFYPSDQKILFNTIDKFFSQLKKEKSEKNVRGLIVPHAGYIYSGLTAAKGYNLLNLKRDSCFVIFGTNHTGYASDFSLSLRDFKTPLGIIKNYSKYLIKDIEEIKDNDEIAHSYEHSIEVQLPFIQFLSKKFDVNCYIVPIICSTTDIKKISKFLKNLVNFSELGLKKDFDVFFIASSDMTHYGYFYNFTPFSNLSYEKIKEKVYEMDKKIISHILKFDTKNFIKEASKTTICGIAPIATLLEIIKKFSERAFLIEYTSSGEISQDWKNFVGYASIAFF